ncbi:MAG: hypothetical protein R3E11_06695 [Sphingobium sp.]|nr:hypothetical protein [Sphingobium sp.]MCP5398180.1 hypothetical protein [Sphingomonas sp.]
MVAGCDIFTVMRKTAIIYVIELMDDRYQDRITFTREDVMNDPQSATSGR